MTDLTSLPRDLTIAEVEAIPLTARMQAGTRTSQGVYDAVSIVLVKVRTVDGTVDLKIPAGVQPGATLLMAKRGVPKLGQPNVRGDQYVTVNVTIPKSVSGKEKELVEELEGLSN